MGAAEGHEGRAGSGAGAGAGAGTGAAVVTVGVVKEGAGAGEGWEPEMVEPSPRFTRLTGASLPLKNSDAEREGSRDGAGGKISDWKLSAWRGQSGLRQG